MGTIESICPRCNVAGQYGEELIGRYTLCHNCRCRFYVEVPTLGQSDTNGAPSRLHASPTPARDTTLDDLLWDTQQGSKFLIQSMARQERQLQNIFYGIALVAAMLAVNVVLALR